MKKLVGVLIIAAIVVGGIIYKESIDRTANLIFLNNNSTTVSSKNNFIESFTNNEILNAANENNNYNFNKVLNKEISGNIMSVKLSNANGNDYIVDLEIVGKNLYQTGKVINLKSEVKENLLSKNNVSQSNGNVIITENNGNSGKKSDYIGGTLGSNNSNNSKKNNFNISNGNDAIKFVLNYYKSQDKSLDIKNLQSTVLANQDIDGENGYLVQVYDNEDNHNKNIGVLLVTKNGNLYDANTDPLEKLN